MSQPLLSLSLQWLSSHHNYQHNHHNKFIIITISNIISIKSYYSQSYLHVLLSSEDSRSVNVKDNTLQKLANLLVSRSLISFLRLTRRKHIIYVSNNVNRNNEYDNDSEYDRW